MSHILCIFPHMSCYDLSENEVIVLYCINCTHSIKLPNVEIQFYQPYGTPSGSKFYLLEKYYLCKGTQLIIITTRFSSFFFHVRSLTIIEYSSD